MEFEVTYTDCWEEMFSLHLEVNDMDDQHLVDEVWEFVDDLDQDINAILVRWNFTKDMPVENRNKLVAYYVLNFGNMELEE